MQAGVGVFIEVVLAIIGAVFFGSAVVAIAAFAFGCAVFGSCWGFIGWRRKRSARLRRRRPE